MKKFSFSLLALSFCLLSPVPSMAGEINTDEQVIIDTIGSDLEYHGETYVANDTYVNKVKDYLCDDSVNLSSTEVSLYIAELNNNMYSYIQSGYLTQKDSSLDNQVETENAAENTDLSEDSNSSFSEDSSTDDKSSSGVESSVNESSTDASSDDESSADESSITDSSNEDSVTTNSTANNPDDSQTSQDTLTNVNNSSTQKLADIESISSVESVFLDYLTSPAIIIIVFLFLLLAVVYIVINKKIIVHVSSLLKVIIMYISISIFSICALTLMFFSNDNYFDSIAINSNYYEYMYSRTENYIYMQSKINQISMDYPELTDYVIRKCFNRSQIRSDVDSYSENSSDTITTDSIVARINSCVEEYNKENEEISVSITNDNCVNWIYNISTYYYDRICFNYMRNIHLMRDNIFTILVVLTIITGMIILAEIINLSFNRRNNMLDRLQYLFCAMLFVVPTILSFLLYANAESLFVQDSGSYSESDYLFMQNVYEQRIIQNFHSSCINSSVYFVVAFLIVLCAIHFLIRYYSNKKYKHNV